MKRLINISFICTCLFSVEASADNLIDLVSRGLEANELQNTALLDSVANAISYSKVPEANIYTNYFRGMSEFYQTSYEAAESYLEQSLKYSTTFGDTCWISRCLHNLAVVSFYLSKERLGTRLVRKALSFRSECVNRSKLLLTLGASYRHLEQFDSSLFYLKAAVNTSRMGDTLVYPYAVNQICEWYAQHDSFSKAINTRNSIIHWVDTSKYRGHYDVLCNYLANQSRDYFSLGMPDSGFFYYNKGMAFIEENELLYNLGGLYSYVADYYNSIEEFDSATFYFMRAFAADESSGDKPGRIAAMENLTTSLESKVLISNLKGEKAGLQRNIAIITGLGILALSTLLIVLTRQRLKHQKVLRAQEEEKHGQQLQQVLSAHELQVMQALAEGQEHERKRLSQELHDTVGNMLATLKLQFESLSDLMRGSDRQNVKVDNTAKLIDETCVEVRRISHNLSTGMVSKMGLIAALRQLVATISSTGKFKIELNHDGDDLDVGGDTEVHLYRIIQEIISNAIKHSGADHISIQVTKHEKELNVIVEDDGKGFDLKQVKKDQKGIGLLNLESRVKHLGGELVIDSKKGRGTAIIIDIKF